MSKIIIILLLITFPLTCMARGGFSSSGRGSFSSSRSFSSPSRSFSMPSRSYSSPRSTVTTRTTTVNRTSNSFGGGYHPMMYPGFGMGYGYSNGILTGLIIGNMMHPQGTTVYNGGGYNQGSALLYPDGKVVDKNGYQVGTYINGQFTAVDGGMVAQPAPADAAAQPVQVGWSTGEVVLLILGTVLVIAIIAVALI